MTGKGRTQSIMVAILAVKNRLWYRLWQILCFIEPTTKQFRKENNVQYQVRGGS